MKRTGHFENLIVNNNPIVAGGVDPSYVNSTIVSTTTALVNTWVNVIGASFTINPVGANEKWEIVGEFDLYISHNSGLQVLANVRIVDSFDNLIDNALRFASSRDISAGGVTAFPTMMIARDTISAPKTYKLQIRKGTDGGSVAVYTGDITGDLGGDDTLPKFYAKRVF